MSNTLGLCGWEYSNTLTASGELEANIQIATCLEKITGGGVNIESCRTNETLFRKTSLYDLCVFETVEAICQAVN